MISINLLKRVIIILPVVLGALTLIFLSIHLIPGDPVDLLVMPGSPKAEFDLMRHNLGLDKPIYVQYFIFFRNLLTGDFGKSIYSRRPVLEEISKCYWATFQLTICAMVVAIIIGLTTGIVAASKKGTIWDHSLRLVAFFGISVPPFWLALILILVVSVNLQLLPVSGVGSFKHFILPSITLGVYTAAMISRFTYGSLLEVMNQDYIRTAKMKGCSEIRVLFLHALKNALVPTVTVVGLQFGYMLAGTVWIETVFAWPGIGRLLVKAILQRDYTLIQGICTVIVITFIMVNLIADAFYAYLDPRLRAQGKAK